MTDADKIRETYHNRNQNGVKYPKTYRLPVQVPVSVTLDDGAVTAPCFDVVEVFQHNNGFIGVDGFVSWVEVYGRLRDSTVLLDHDCQLSSQVRLQYTKTLERNAK